MNEHILMISKLNNLMKNGEYIENEDDCPPNNGDLDSVNNSDSELELSSDPEVVYAKTSDFVQDGSKKPKKKKKVKKKPLTELEQKAMLYLSK